jgi:hypothetical protein
MLVGLDFDNTIVCYHRLFHRLARERGLVPETLPVSKGAVRDHLRSIDQEPVWTAMQGEVYGPRISEAEPFLGVKEFLDRCRENDVRVAIVSHKTRHPYLGPKHDLHAAAHTFLTAHGFYDTARTGLTSETVYLELTLKEKLERIRSLGCDAFVDDLPELLAEPAFPSSAKKVLFDPAGTNPDHSDYARASSWADVSRIVLNGSKP